MQEIDFNAVEREVAAFVTNMYESPDKPHYPYHNLTHTQRVVTYAKEIAAHYELNTINTFTVSVAAWFHDVGHQNGPMPGHEARGVAIMEAHLHSLPTTTPPPERLTPPEIITAIARCILATKFPSHPADLLEQLICDADTYHLGTDLFRQTDPLVKKEVQLRTGMVPAEAEWTRKTLSLLKQHTFFTDYCQKKLNEKKQQNIAWLESQLTS